MARTTREACAKKQKENLPLPLGERKLVLKNPTSLY